MKISIVVAVGKNNQIGKGNKLLWNIKDDLKHFKNLTLNHHILMGRKTFESIGRALPKRTNMIITRNTNFVAPEECLIFDCSYKAIDFAKNNGETELFVCGGATIYKFFLENNLVDNIYLTRVDFDGEADSFFPELNMKNWNIEKISSFEKNEINEYSGEIFVLKRQHK